MYDSHYLMLIYIHKQYHYFMFIYIYTHTYRFSITSHNPFFFQKRIQNQ